MEIIDPYMRQKRFNNWKLKEIKGISKINAKLLREFILDMEMGLNVNGGKKGARSPGRLLSNISQLKRFFQLLEEHYKIKDVRKLKEKQLHQIVHKLTSGEIKKLDGGQYAIIGDFIKRFKVFWKWHIKRTQKEGKTIPNITDDLSGEFSKKPSFVYFKDNDLEKMGKYADYETNVLMSFLFDTGARSPKESFNIRVSDFSDDFSQVQIREETSKTFGRKVRLMLCSRLIREYIEDNNLSGDDLLFPFNPATINKRLRAIGKKVLGEKPTLGREKGSQLSLYDFRHSSACYWLLRYKSRSSLLYRFGWTKEQQILYYTELLGMRDTIAEEDMLVGITKTELENKMELLKKEMLRIKKVIGFIQEGVGKKQLEKIKFNKSFYLEDK